MRITRRNKFDFQITNEYDHDRKPRFGDTVYRGTVRQFFDRRSQYTRLGADFSVRILDTDGQPRALDMHGQTDLKNLRDGLVDEVTL